MTAAINGKDDRANELFGEMLQKVLDSGWKPRQEKEKTLVGFWSLTGSHWSGDLMVVGRFVNGWTAHERFDDIVDLSKRDQFVKHLITTEFHQAPCPTTKFWRELCERHYRSPFWYAIRDVSAALRLGEDWISKLVYSSLYRLGPKTGNPSSSLCSLQLDGCRKLFQYELELRHPRRVLIMTGRNWAKPFLEAMRMKERTPGDLRYVDYVGDFLGAPGSVRIVVSKHPQGKRRQPLVAEVLSAFDEGR